MGVPILKLPFVALKILLDHLSNVELVAVSLLSKRADWFLKSCGKKNVSFFNLPDFEIWDLQNIEKIDLLLLEIRRRGALRKWSFSMSCSVSGSLYIDISASGIFYCKMYIETLEDIEKFVGVRRNLKIGDSFVPAVSTIENDKKSIHTFWNNQSFGLISSLDFFKSEFDLPIDSLKIGQNKNPKILRDFIRHINTTQTVLNVVYVSDRQPISEDDYKFVLENVSPTCRFDSSLKTSSSFKFNGKIKSKVIEIGYGHWFTLENLMKNNDYEQIVVKGSDFTVTELRTFLEEWKAGKFPKLKKVGLGTKVPKSAITEGFERRKDKCSKKGRYYQYIALEGPAGSYGKTASYSRISDGCFHMGIHND